MENQSFTDVLILAGGIGERLWPASQPDCPKQFMSFADKISFLQSAILRALALKPAGKIVIITRKSLLLPISNNVAGLLPSLNNEDQAKIKNDLIILTESVPRHTCAPLVIACKMLQAMDSSQHTVLVLASDHVIKTTDQFAADCAKAALTANKGYFVCFAIPPDTPDTGYGYIQMGSSIEKDNSIVNIEMFKEKPDLETAKQYLASGKYTWNSGMFAFTDRFFLNEVAKCAPDVAEAFPENCDSQIPQSVTQDGIKYISGWTYMDNAYDKVPAIAVDNAVAERTSKAAAIKTTFSWDDVGSWDAFEKYFEKNDSSTVEVSSNNNFVYSDIPVALCGVDDLIVVIKHGKALVMKKGASANMREVVKQAKARQ